MSVIRTSSGRAALRAEELLAICCELAGPEFMLPFLSGESRSELIHDKSRARTSIVPMIGGGRSSSAVCADNSGLIRSEIHAY